MANETILNRNSKAIAKMEECVRALKSKLPGQSLPAKARINSRIRDLQTQITKSRVINAHLTAGGVIVEMDHEKLDELADLEAQLATFIVEDAELNAVLAMIPEVINSAKKIGDIINT
jgi:hypothetical protein